MEEKNDVIKNESQSDGIDLTSENTPEFVLEEKLKESNDKYLRLAAEFENYKRRVQKDKDDLITNTKIKMIQSILDIDNDLNFAIKSSGEISDGVKLIVSKIDSFLKSQGIENIQTEEYDEDLHEVISVIPSDETKVIDVVCKGYTLNGKPFRYPKIILGKANA